MNMNRNHILILIVAVLVTFGISFPIGYFSRKVKKQDNSYYESLLNDNDKSYTKMVVDTINSENMKNHLKYLTSIPHMGGTPGDKLSADYVFNNWKEQKLDHVEMTDYDVYLSFPDDDKFNNIQLTSASGTQSFDIEEPTYDPNLNYTGIPKPFLAYAKEGSVSSNEVYYANYGTEEDFLELQKQGIDVTGKIVICRYGGIFRGNKVDFGEKFGAKGVILYDDPKRIAPASVRDQIYPNGQYLPGKGVQRGSIFVKNGDPLTPGYPSTASAFRLNPDTEKDLGLPNIPAQVIGYDLAEKIFKLMEQNKKVNDSWAGEMNVTYTYGGKLSGDTVLTLNVYNQRKIAKTYNVQAMILGSVEPDKYVIIGNHRDAWSFGSLDPTSGTSVMLEISRALMDMKLKKGWTPKRSILFTSWGSEEYGLIGSVEWVEEYKKKLAANAVAYLNFDTVVKGNYSFRAAASPSLYQLLFDVTKSLKMSETETVYDRWIKNEPSADKPGQPKVSPYLGSGSDYMGFVQKVGIPALDQGFVRDTNDPNNKYLALTSYPTYHSSYETFRLINDYIDPDFTGFKMSGTIAAELLRTLADSLILPIDVVTYAKEIQTEFGYFQRDYKATMDALGISLDQFKQSIDDLASVALSFQERLNKIDKTKYHLVRMYNEQLRKFEGAFLDSSGVNREGYEHMVYAPSISDSYGGDAFPALTDAIYDYNKDKSEQNKNAIKMNLSIIIYAIQSAASILKDPFDFSRGAN